MESGLKKKLLELNLFTQDKISLWLCYKHKKLGVVTTTKSDPDLESIYKWIEESGMKYKTNTDFASIESPAIIVSYDENIVKELNEILADHSERATITKGKILGYPEISSKSFVKFWKDPKNHPMVGGTNLVRNGWDNKYKYVIYMVRKGHEQKDSKVGLEWADFIRKDFPELAKIYEEEELPQIR
jgi:hypothetical protein